MQITKKCFECKQIFRKTELIDYASPAATVTHSYCPKCLIEKQERDNFAIKVCQIFGIKAPGPRIWTERKRLKEQFGYTDQTIIDCLEYIYNVKKLNKLTDSLCLVKPPMVEQMLQYKHNIEYKNNNIINAMNMETKEHIVPTNIKQESIKSNNWNPDDWLDDDV